MTAAQKASSLFPLPLAPSLTPGKKPESLPLCGLLVLGDGTLEAPGRAPHTVTYPKPHSDFVNLVQDVLIASKHTVVDIVHSCQGCLLCFWVITVGFSVSQSCPNGDRAATPELSKAKEQGEGPHGCSEGALTAGQMA